MLLHTLPQRHTALPASAASGVHKHSRQQLRLSCVHAGVHGRQSAPAALVSGACPAPGPVSSRGGQTCRSSAREQPLHSPYPSQAEHEAHENYASPNTSAPSANSRSGAGQSLLTTRRAAATSLLTLASSTLPAPSWAQEPEPQGQPQPAAGGSDAGAPGFSSSKPARDYSAMRRALPARIKKVPLVPGAGAEGGEKKRGKRKGAQGDTVQVSQIIRGCWQLDGQHRGEPESDRTSGREALQDLSRFHDAGFTTLDTADIYGPSEAVIGQWLRLNPERVPHTQVITKITIAEEDVVHLNKDMLEYRLRRSLARLGLPRVDLVQLHWEDYAARSPKGASYVDAALWLADLQGAGLTKGVGLTNFDSPHLLQVLDAGVPLAAHQVQWSVLDRRPSLFMSDLCLRRGVPILAYGTLAGGWLSDKWANTPAKKAALDTMSKAKYGAQLKEAGGWAWLQEMVAALQRVGERHGGVPASAVAIAWTLSQPGVAAAVVGARNATHLRSLALATTLNLSEDDYLELDAAAEGASKPAQGDVFQWERGGEW